MFNIIRLLIFILFYIFLIFGPLLILRNKLVKNKKQENIETKKKLKIFSIFVLATIIMGIINFFVIHNLNTLNSVEIVSNQIELNTFFSSLAVLLELIVLVLWGTLFTNTMYKLTLYKDIIFRILSSVIFLVGYYFVFLILLFSFFGFFMSYIYPFKIIEAIAQLLLFIPIVVYLSLIAYKTIKNNNH